MATQHFLSLVDLSPVELRGVIMRAIELKKMLRQGKSPDIMKLKTAVLMFEKSSTRTRVSFETGVGHFSGKAIFLAPSESHLDRGESIEDTARVLSRMADIIVIRTSSHERIQRIAKASNIPVINGLSDYNHPCQLLADIQAFIEHRGEIQGKKVAWIGDGNNVCHSWMNAARLLDFQLHIATPGPCQPCPSLLAQCKSNIVLSTNPQAVAQDADLIVTDTWSSMGYEKDKTERKALFAGFCVDSKLMALAHSDALFMHCLPAYRGCEVTAEVIDGPQSIVWDEAENRLHAQKALMEFLLIQNSTQENVG